MVGYWIHEYLKNNDLTTVDFVDIKNLDEPYPAISICFEHPFIEEKLKAIHRDLNSSYYLKYLKGKHEDTRLRDVYYHNVTIEITKSQPNKETR